jgi:sulfopyruvate decarboxylase subunit beta
MMRRDEAFAALAAVRNDAIVVPVFTSAFEWERVSPHRWNLPATGSMGQASSHALGLALGLPHHTVIVIDGDGSLLMNLGSLVTIGTVAPRNLIHFVADNGTYEANGSHPTPAQHGADFAGIAKAAGYRTTFTFADLATFVAELPGLMRLDGPTFATLKIVPGETPLEYDYAWMHGPETRAKFKRAVKPLLREA